MSTYKGYASNSIQCKYFYPISLEPGTVWDRVGGEAVKGVGAAFPLETFHHHLLNIKSTQMDFSVKYIQHT